MLKDEFDRVVRSSTHKMRRVDLEWRMTFEAPDGRRVPHVFTDKLDIPVLREGDPDIMWTVAPELEIDDVKFPPRLAPLSTLQKAKRITLDYPETVYVSKTNKLSFTKQTDEPAKQTVSQGIGGPWR